MLILNHSSQGSFQKFLQILVIKILYIHNNYLNDLNLGGSWSPAISDKNQYLQVDFGQTEPIYGVIIMGSPIYNEYVTSYHVLYDDGSNNFKYVLDKSGLKKVDLFKNKPQ